MNVEETRSLQNDLMMKMTVDEMTVDEMTGDISS
jgi:hypothetical protein